MCRLKKRIAALEKSVSDIQTHEWCRLREDSADLYTTRELLSKIPLDVKSVGAYIDDNTGDTHIRIKYKAPEIDLVLDEKGNPNKDEKFYAMNILNIISLQDMMKIQKVLDEEKKKIVDNIK